MSKKGQIQIGQVQDLQNFIDTINGLVLKVDAGDWDPADPFPGGASVKAGYSFDVIANGTRDGVEFDIDDNLVALVDNPSTTTFSPDWKKEDNADRVLSVRSEEGNVTGVPRAVEFASAPTVNDDNSINYEAGDIWIDTTGPTVYKCYDASPGAAVWRVMVDEAPIDGTQYTRKDGAWEAVVQGGGLVGIPDSNGLFTYSTDVKTAIEGATAGQTVFLFGDCETTTWINVPNGVDIQGNSFKIFNQQADATGVFFINDNTGYIGKWSNLTLEKTNATGGPNTVYIYGGAVSGPTQIECSNVKVTSDDTSQAAFYLRNALAGNFVKGLTTISPFGIQSDSGDVIECSAFATTNYAIYAPNPASKVVSCYGETVSGPVFSGNIFMNCTGVSVSGDVCVGGSHYNGTYFSTSGRVTTAPLYNCQGSTTSTNPASISILENSSIKNFGSGDGHRTFNFGLRILNSVIYSGGGIGAGDTNPTSNAQYINCTIESAWNNSSGHAVRGGTGMKIIGCSLKVANSSANCITCTDGEFANNTYEGATTSVVGTQLITNLTDNQGNISI